MIETGETGNLFERQVVVRSSSLQRLICTLRISACGERLSSLRNFFSSQLRDTHRWSSSSWTVTPSQARSRMNRSAAHDHRIGHREHVRRLADGDAFGRHLDLADLTGVSPRIMRSSQAAAS